MKLSKERVAHIADCLARRLQQQGHVDVLSTPKALADTLNHVMTEELSVEDKLNDEVRTLMKKYEAEIERGHVDYQKMFTMIKKQLVKEREIIL